MQASRDNLDGEDRRKHLDFIQAVITRMSAASSNAKGWLLPVVTVAYGYSLTKPARSIAVLGILAVALFAFIDANYLRQEKAYRRLYDAVARKTRDVPHFSLDPSEAIDATSPPKNERERLMHLIGKWFPAYSVWLSWSIAPFYGALLLMGIVVFCVSGG
jgi:hypothetical protein